MGTNNKIVTSKKKQSVLAYSLSLKPLNMPESTQFSLGTTITCLYKADENIVPKIKFKTVTREVLNSRRSKAYQPIM